MALAFGSQAAAGRPLGVPAITTVVVTSAMVDLFADPFLFSSPWNVKAKGRNQRVAFVVVFFIGGIVGGLGLRGGDGLPVLLAGCVKVVAMGCVVWADGEGKVKGRDVEKGKETEAVRVEKAGEKTSGESAGMVGGGEKKGEEETIAKKIE
jgi:hypothetical protein